MWKYILGGATVFGLIITLGAWINGRVTRREISKLIVEEHKVTRELMERMFAKSDERFQELLKEIRRANEGLIEGLRE